MQRSQEGARVEEVLLALRLEGLAAAAETVASGLPGPQYMHLLLAVCRRLRIRCASLAAVSAPPWPAVCAPPWPAVHHCLRFGTNQLSKSTKHLCGGPFK